jgi:HD superfamily phosphohydrolase
MVKPFKKIYDSLHGFIRFDDDERELIDSLPFQRLHYIRQLGIAYLIYPGATHSRFEHSLGVMEIATRIFDKICQMVRPDIFQIIPRKGSAEYIYWEKVIRLGALCHDLGHLPFSHVAERALLKEKGHEELTLKILESSYLKPFWDKMQEKSKMQERNIKEDVIKTAIGEDKLKRLKKYNFTPWERIVSWIISGNFFGADRIDYLLRDSRYTGIAYGMFDYMQLIEQLRILPINGDDLSLGIDENGIESTEALLLARHFMYKRVYQYPSVKALGLHLRKFMMTYCLENKHLLEIENFLYFNDADIIAAIMKTSRDKSHALYHDAKAIVQRTEHLKAIKLPSYVTKEDVEAFKQDNKLKEWQINLEFHDKVDSGESPSFFVAKKQLKIMKIEECSDILKHLPSTDNNWLYIAPEFELLFMHAIEKK